MTRTTFEAEFQPSSTKNAGRSRWCEVVQAITAVASVAIAFFVAWIVFLEYRGSAIAMDSLRLQTVGILNAEHEKVTEGNRRKLIDTFIASVNDVDKKIVATPEAEYAARDLLNFYEHIADFRRRAESDELRSLVDDLHRDPARYYFKQLKPYIDDFRKKGAEQKSAWEALEKWTAN